MTARYLVAVAAMVAALGVAPARSGAAGGIGPELSVPSSLLSRATWCDPSVTPTSGRQAVLLVHGTGGTPVEYWDWNWKAALPHYGYGVCTVTLPNRALTSALTSAEYVAYAARYAYQHSGRKIAIVGHSQGGSLAVWAAKFWSDVAQHTEDVISLAGAFNGFQLSNTACAAQLYRCPAIDWQLGMGSHFMRALQSAPVPLDGPAITSIYSRTDEFAYPEPAASTLDGGTNIAVQDVCPLHVADHIVMIADAVAFALALDALAHPGPADSARITNRAHLCLQQFLPYANVVAGLPLINTGVAFLYGLLFQGPKLSAEPTLPGYAYPYGKEGPW
jgi:pimeloyl-ACP methyl ester carboxylesterase